MAHNLYLNRTIEDVLIEASQYFSVISVTGPRQSGKSTLLKHLFPDIPRYSMKDVNVREFAEHDPVAFLHQHPNGMFIDEVQKVPQLLEYIQGIVDDNPDCRFLLTGSSNFELLHGLCESLPGRAGVYELLPMTYHTSFEGDISQLSDWIKTPVVNKIIVYTGDFENTASDIKILNYRHLQAHLPQNPR